MGRGLSPLQQTIITLAYQNIQAGDAHGDTPESAGADVYYHEVLNTYFGWPYVHRYGVATEEQLSQRVQRRSRTGWHFDRKRIGAKRYASGQAALSRAVVRLVCRGLVEQVRGAYSLWVGVNLTPAGRAHAAQGVRGTDTL